MRLTPIFFICRKITSTAKLSFGATLNTWGVTGVTMASAAVLAVKDEPDQAAIRKNFAVIPGDGGVVKRVIEKPRVVPNRIKGCGIYLFDDRIFEVVRRGYAPASPDFQTGIPRRRALSARLS